MAARPPIRHSRSARWARRLAVLSLPVLVLTALGNRFGLMPTEAVAPTVALGYGLALVAFALAVFALVRIWNASDEGAGEAFAALFFAAPALVLFGLAMVALVIYPPLNDLTTDVDDPPRFWAHPHEAISLADAQRQATTYPRLAARFYPLSVERVFAAAQAVVKDRGWKVEESLDPIEGEGIATIEAVARTILFAFPDDVVIRIAPTTDGDIDGTIVDMRSASRFGRHDLGKNARRIKDFLRDLDGVLQGTIEVEPAPEDEEEERFGPLPRPEPPSS
ncbi:hypothetical protein J2R99_000537 [Rhodopseudomonas julia]|uniref:DUF1499 domain-containing protein n=1 Tax=Rhodopseudomonas julia TaxID=200617 RepID=A0ABU0C2E7_9BRAD|nr:DUF1499 domain-containing protein [Rhodopseudomonas julia]MDQ0324688.1 hypothetical protein [Rhodopseudomonas julia]